MRYICRLSGILLVVLSLAACSFAGWPVTPPKATPDPVFLTSDPGGLLTPDVGALTPASGTPIPTPIRTATPTVRAALAATPSPPLATETPPPDVGFADCDVMTRAQAETILGPLDGDPFPLEWIGPNARRAAICIFAGSLNTASVFVLWYDTEAEARAGYAQGSGGEPVTGVGDAAVWDQSALMLSALRDTVVVGIEMIVPDGAREQAIQIGQIAVVRIP